MSVHAADGIERELGVQQPAPFLAWPGLSHLWYCLVLALASGIWFVLVYAGCDFVTGKRTLRVPIDLPGERMIPFVAWATALYLSIYVWMIAGPFILRTRTEFRAVIAALAVATGIAGICFLLIPAELAFPPVQASELGMWAPLFRFADAVNLTYNLLPSLHVTLTVVCVAAFSTRIEGVGRTLLWMWAGAVALSTLLIHQHHLLDVLSGWALALLCFKYVYEPLVKARNAP
jgi:membrane-associated phospholipid phosphatase